MSEGGWVALGAAIGAGGTLLTTLLNTWLSRSSPDYLDRKAMKVLRNELSKKSAPPWQHIRALSSIVGLSHVDTKALLLLIDATGDPSNPDQWALISRQGTEEKRG